MHAVEPAVELVSHAVEQIDDGDVEPAAQERLERRLRLELVELETNIGTLAAELRDRGGQEARPRRREPSDTQETRLAGGELLQLGFDLGGSVEQLLRPPSHELPGRRRPDRSGR